MSAGGVGGGPRRLARGSRFQSEEAEGYEIGVESNLFDGSMRLNGTLFSYDYSNLQVRNAKHSGYVGFSYDIPLGASNWRTDLSFDARYNDGYPLQGTLDTREMDSYWLTDAAIRFYREDGRYELAFIGKNLGDEIVE